MASPYKQWVENHCKIYDYYSENRIISDIKINEVVNVTKRNTLNYGFVSYAVCYTVYIHKKFQLILQSSNTGLHNFILCTATYPDDHSPLFNNTRGSKSKTRKDIQFRKILS